VASPGDALAAVLPDAPPAPLQRYLAAAERPDADDDLRDGRTDRLAPGPGRCSTKCSVGDAGWVELDRDGASRENRGGGGARAPGGGGGRRICTCTLLSFQKDGSSCSSNRAGAETSSSPSDSIPAAAADAVEAEMDVRWLGSGAERRRRGVRMGRRVDGGSGF
jgi:hypothetical protein